MDMGELHGRLLRGSWGSAPPRSRLEQTEWQALSYHIALIHSAIERGVRICYNETKYV